MQARHEEESSNWKSCPTLEEADSCNNGLSLIEGFQTEAGWPAVRNTIITCTEKRVGFDTSKIPFQLISYDSKQDTQQDSVSVTYTE